MWDNTVELNVTIKGSTVVGDFYQELKALFEKYQYENPDTFKVHQRSFALMGVDKSKPNNEVI